MHLGPRYYDKIRRKGILIIFVGKFNNICTMG